MPTRDVYYVIFKKSSYTREDTQLNTLISYVLLVLCMYVYAPHKDLRVRNVALFQSTVLQRETLNITSDIKSHSHESLPQEALTVMRLKYFISMASSVSANSSAITFSKAMEGFREGLALNGWWSMQGRAGVWGIVDNQGNSGL